MAEILESDNTFVIVIVYFHIGFILFRFAVLLRRGIGGVASCNHYNHFPPQTSHDVVMVTRVMHDKGRLYQR